MANFRTRVWMTLIGVAVLSSIPVFVVAGSGDGMGVALGGMVLAVSIAALGRKWRAAPGLAQQMPPAPPAWLSAGRPAP